MIIFYFVIYCFSPAIVREAHETYKLASELASKILPSTHPTRLAVALNFSTFYNDVMEEPEKACDLAKEVRKNIEWLVVIDCDFIGI